MDLNSSRTYMYLKHFEVFNFRATHATKFAVYLMDSSVDAGTWRIYL